MFLGNLYILYPHALWVFEEFHIALCCIGEKVEPQRAQRVRESELRTKRSLISEADVYPERMKKQD